jgi:PAS domain S-box-containing protein
LERTSTRPAGRRRFIVIPEPALAADLDDFFENAPFGLLWADGEGAIQRANRAALDLLGGERDDVVGRRLTDFHVDPGLADALLSRLERGEELRDLEARLRRRDGSIVHARIDGNAARQGDRLVRMRWILHDGEEARRSAEVRDSFLNLIAHELRNPLAPIRTSLQILEQPDLPPLKAAEARRRMDRQLTHLSRLVNDLLDVSRLVTGRLQVRREPIDLGVLTREVIDDHRPTFDTAGVRLEVRVPETSIWVDGDRLRLAQALGNLLQNGSKFTEPGGWVEVHVERDGEAALRLVVRDTGAGMSREQIARLFQPFAREPRSVMGTHGGLGFGLMLAHRLVELHGGRLTAESAGPGQGSRFVLWLPTCAAPDEVGGAEPRSSNGRHRRILVIEDHTDTADSLADLLRLKGHEVTVARNGFAGLARAHHCRPHIVFCDLGLPGKLDGFEVARALRHDPELGSAVLVALTGYGRAEDQRRATDSGFDAHLTKPADPATLDRMLAGFSPILEGRASASV